MHEEITSRDSHKNAHRNSHRSTDSHSVRYAELLIYRLSVNNRKDGSVEAFLVSFQTGVFFFF